MAEIKTDCFAYKEKLKKCVALDDLYCKREECKFYKSKSQKGREEKEHE